MALLKGQQKSYSGFYKPQNPKKYMGNPKRIVYRSSWELKFMKYLDEHPDVISWASEEFSIPYLSPKDRKVHRYFPDFFVKKRNKDGVIESLVIEIKPKQQTTLPQKQKLSRRYIQEVTTYAVNEAKWKQAKEFCEDKKWKFLILTEHELFPKGY